MHLKNVVRLGMLIAAAAITSFLESMLPLPLPVPGIRLGLANLVSIVALHSFPGYTVIGMVIARCLLAGWMAGSLIMLAGSLAGGLISTALLVFVYRRARKHFSLKGMSAIAGAVHPAAQLAYFAALPGMHGLVIWLPVLLVCGAAAGWVVGWLSEKIARMMPWLENINERMVWEVPEVSHDQGSGA